jgi:signal peptidase I
VIDKENYMFGKIFKIIVNTVLGILVVIGILAVFSFVPIPGNFKLFTVQSGSMEPTIKTGSLIFVKPTGEYNVGNIITKWKEDKKVTITHRVMSKEGEDGKIIYQTKGDANNAPDSDKITKEQIIGKMLWSLPYLGYPVGFAKTAPGLIIIIILPAVIIIYDEMNKIKKEIGKMREKKKAEKGKRENEPVENKLVYPEPQFVRRVEPQEAKKRKIV